MRRCTSDVWLWCCCLAEVPRAASLRLFAFRVPLILVLFNHLALLTTAGIRHYVFHVVYGATQLPMIYMLWAELRQSR